MSIGSSNPGIVAKVSAGTNVTVTGTPTNPIINSSGGGGGSGALTQIQQIITSASQASVTFSAIPGTFTNLILRYIGRSLSVTAADDLKMQFNGDTGNNYTTQVTVSIGTAVSGIPIISASAFVIGTLTASTSTAGMSGGGSLIIPGYVQTLFNKTGSGLMSYAQISANLTSFISGLQWANTAAITSIALFPNLGSGFLNGSIFTLYGEQ